MESGFVRVYDSGDEALLADLANCLGAMNEHDRVQPRRMALLLCEFLTLDARIEADARAKLTAPSDVHSLKTVRPGRKTA